MVEFRVEIYGRIHGRIYDGIYGRIHGRIYDGI